MSKGMWVGRCLGGDEVGLESGNSRGNSTPGLASLLHPRGHGNPLLRGSGCSEKMSSRRAQSRTNARRRAGEGRRGCRLVDVSSMWSLAGFFWASRGPIVGASAEQGGGDVGRCRREDSSDLMPRRTNVGSLERERM